MIQDLVKGEQIGIRLGANTAALIALSINMGAYGYLLKPYDLHQLLIMLQRAIEKQAAGAALLEMIEQVSSDLF